MNKSETATMNTEEIGTTNRKHKDRLFRLIFSEKKDLLELCNAINGTHYTNDLSFIIGDSLNLYEHQSSSCGNMPLRGLFYIASVYRKYAKKEKGNLYGSATIRQKLKEYAILVAKIRKYTEQELTIKEAVEQAIADCLQEDVLTDILTNHRWEVLDVILTEYDEAEHMEIVKAEGIAEGRTMGIAEGRSLGVAEGRAATADVLIKVLTTRSDVPEQLKQRIFAQKDLETLKQWVDLALAAKSVHDFEEQM